MSHQYPAEIVGGFGVFAQPPRTCEHVGLLHIYVLRPHFRITDFVFPVSETRYFPQSFARVKVGRAHGWSNPLISAYRGNFARFVAVDCLSYRQHPFVLSLEECCSGTVYIIHSMLWRDSCSDYYFMKGENLEHARENESSGSSKSNWRVIMSHVFVYPTYVAHDACEWITARALSEKQCLVESSAPWGGISG